MYINHINTLANQQDSACVILITEDILNCIRRILPHIMTVVMQSDNAILYQKVIVPSFIHLLIKSTGLSILQYIHTKTVASKGTSNGHFVTTMMIVCAYVDAGFNACTLSQTACTLTYNGGGYNCISEYI